MVRSHFAYSFVFARRPVPSWLLPYPIGYKLHFTVEQSDRT